MKELIRIIFHFLFPKKENKIIKTNHPITQEIYSASTQSITFNAVGMHYYKSAYDNLRNKDEILLKLEPNNTHDKYAVALIRKIDNTKFGYVNRNSNKKIHSYLKSSLKYHAFVKLMYGDNCTIQVNLLK